MNWTYYVLIAVGQLQWVTSKYEICLDSFFPLFLELLYIYPNFVMKRDASVLSNFHPLFLHQGKYYLVPAAGQCLLLYVFSHNKEGARGFWWILLHRSPLWVHNREILNVSGELDPAALTPTPRPGLQLHTCSMTLCCLGYNHEISF